MDGSVRRPRRTAMAALALLVSAIASPAAAAPAVRMHPGMRHGKMPACVAGMDRQALRHDRVSVTAMEHMEMPGRGACVPFRPVLRTRGWRVRASSSAPGHPAAELLGAHRHGYWMSARSAAGWRSPQTLTIVLPARRTVTGLRYRPRARAGEIGRFRLSVSSDGIRFHTVAYGRWQDNPTTKQVGWAPTSIRAVRLTVLSPSPARSSTVAAARIELTGVRRAAMPDAGSMHGHAAATSTDPAVVGRWGPTMALPLIPVAAALVPGDRLVVWSADEAFNYDLYHSPPYTQTAVIDLATGAVSPSTVTNTGDNMFCPGVSILPDGRVLVTGGISNQATSLYDPATDSWSAGPPMNIGRGYQGQTTLSDGQAFVLGGSWSGQLGGKLGEIFSPAAAWRELTGVPADPIETNDAEGVYRADNHGWFVASSSGTVFQAGPSKEMHWITTDGAGTITDAGRRGSAPDEMNGTAVPYDVGKLLTSGGAPDYKNSDATGRADVVDISGGPGRQPRVTATAPMHAARGFENSVALPDGDVFTVGGETHPIPFDDATSVMSPEMWSPATGRWTTMAAQAEPRNYHSVAVLLPDGTVYSGGGGLCGTCSVNHPDGQIYEPPYLFDADGSLATRPVITSAPARASLGQTISVTTGGPVTHFALMRYGEATHSVDNDQRRIPLTIVSQSQNTYALALPSDPGVALPGPYMLFALDAHGTPSVAATVTIPPPAAAQPPSAYGQAVAAGGPAMSWPLDDAAGPSATDWAGSGDGGLYSGSGVGYRTPSPVEGSGGAGVSLDGGQVISSRPVHAPTSYTEAAWIRTTATSGVITRFGDSADGGGEDTDRVVYLTPTGRISFGTWTGATNVVTSPLAYNDDEWHFVVASQGADGMHLYVDGAEVASGPVTGAQDYPGYFQVGGTVNAGWPDAGDSAFAGSVSDVAMYVRELSPVEVAALAEAGGATPPVTTTTTTTTTTPTVPTTTTITTATTTSPTPPPVTTTTTPTTTRTTPASTHHRVVARKRRHRSCTRRVRGRGPQAVRRCRRPRRPAHGRPVHRRHHPTAPRRRGPLAAEPWAAHRSERP